MMSQNDSNKEENREKVIEKHKKTLSTQLHYIKKTERKLLPIRDDIEIILSNLHRTRTTKENELNLVNKYPDRFCNLNEDNWNNYRRSVYHELTSEPTVKDFSVDVVEIGKEIPPLLYTSISGTTSTCSDYTAVVYTLKNNYVGDHEFMKVLKEKEPKDDFWDNVDFIKEEMNKQLSSTGDNFEISINSFTTTPSNEKYKRLMDIREALFDNFLDLIIHDQSMYCKLNWFQSSASKAEVYCQTKYYIQNSLEDSQLPTSTVTGINRLSQDIRNIYKNISDWGHKGISDDFAEYFVKREVVPTFRSVLQMKL